MRDLAQYTLGGSKGRGGQLMLFRASQLADQIMQRMNSVHAKCHGGLNYFETCDNI
ncbi:hypothetical protein ACJX0J_026023, partial [Zea mays]